MKQPHARSGAMALMIFGAMVSLAAPCRAQTYDPKYPVCLQVYDDFTHYYFECSYTSMPQCQASASGRYAQCVVNPYYAGPNAKRSPRKKALDVSYCGDFRNMRLRARKIACRPSSATKDRC